MYVFAVEWRDCKKCVTEHYICDTLRNAVRLAVDCVNNTIADEIPKLSIKPAAELEIDEDDLFKDESKEFLFCPNCRIRRLKVLTDDEIEDTDVTFNEMGCFSSTML